VRLLACAVLTTLSNLTMGYSGVSGLGMLSALPFSMDDPVLIKQLD
jgi:hypothetical protein